MGAQIASDDGGGRRAHRAGKQLRDRGNHRCERALKSAVLRAGSMPRRDQRAAKRRPRALHRAHARGFGWPVRGARPGRLSGDIGGGAISRCRRFSPRRSHRGGLLGHGLVAAAACGGRRPAAHRTAAGAARHGRGHPRERTPRRALRAGRRHLRTACTAARHRPAGCPGAGHDRRISGVRGGGGVCPWPHAGLGCRRAAVSRNPTASARWRGDWRRSVRGCTRGRMAC